LGCVTQPKENGGSKKQDAKGGVAIRMPYLRVVDIQDDSDSDSFTANFTCASHVPILLDGLPLWRSTA